MNFKRAPRAISLSVAIGIAVGTGLFGLTVGVAAQSSMQLVLYKNSVMTDARKINGRLYVPVTDVAKAMGWKLSVQGSKILIQPPPPTAAPDNPMASNLKLSGGINEELYTGKYRFKVNTVSEVDRYERKYANGLAASTPLIAGSNEKLVVLDCVLTNATTDREEFVVSRDRWAENTVLLDAKGESLAPFGYDVAVDEVNPPGVYALTGATVKFALVFQVPKTWQSKALIYTIVRYSERGMKKGTDVRVNLLP